jgi:Co/Zn/Cd efflux system component
VTGTGAAVGAKADRVVERVAEGYGWVMFTIMGLFAVLIAVALVAGAGAMLWDAIRPASHPSTPAGPPPSISYAPTTSYPFLTTVP